MLFFQKTFYHVIDRTKFSKIVDVYYEDLIADTNCLLVDFNIKIDSSLSKKSPYNSHDLITNVDELYKIYQQLEQVPITQQKIDIVKSTIESDLLDIRLNHNGNRKI